MSKSRFVGIGGAAVAAGIAVTAMVGQFEGLSLKAYRDVVGVWTICYGETKNVRAGQVHTKPECEAMLLESIVAHEHGMRKCLRNPDELPDSVYIAFASLTYNVGIGAFCKSTAARLANAGDLKGACAAMKRFNRAGGRVWQGLVNRREREYQYCIKGI